MAFVTYLWILYRQVDTAFNSPAEFLPTRVYSDLTRIYPTLSRTYVENRLGNLRYAVQKTEGGLRFRLHQAQYPDFLLPEGNETRSCMGEEVQLTFLEGNLSTIECEGKPLPELYLEPELVTTLSRGGPGAATQIRDFTKFEDIPAHVWKAIIAIEDHHYLDHKGFDPRGLARAVLVNLKTLSFAQGGSTITQQLVKNLTVRRTKNIFKKINELILALILEVRYDKEKILERYLNEVYLGQVGNLEIHGVAEGARHFFGKTLSEISLAEAAMMAGLIRGPGYYSPYRRMDRAKARQELVLDRMAETQAIDGDEADEAKKQKIKLAPPPVSGNKAPYFTDYVKAKLIEFLAGRYTEDEISSAGLHVFTTLDTYLNQIAQVTTEQEIQKVEARFGISDPNLLEGALASVDHKTGQIRALVGGKSYRRSTFNRILNMKRQVGSTFKPLVYLSALRKGKDEKGVPYGPAYPLEDAPWKLTFDHGKQFWGPKNYDKEFLGWIPARTALAHSINVIAAKLGMAVGLDLIADTAKSLGVTSEIPKVPSLTLGVLEASPVELLQVYATIANRGIRDDLTVIRAITQDDGTGFARFVFNPKQVFESKPLELLTEMMKQAFVDGTAKSASAYGFTRPAAGKTGTTSNNRDSWFAGFTPELTTVVWVGLDTGSAEVDELGESKLKLTGAGAALPIWASFMRKALAHIPPGPFPESGDLEDVTINRESGLRALSDCPEAHVVTDKYIRGSVPDSGTCEILWPPTISESEM